MRAYVSTFCVLLCLLLLGCPKEQTTTDTTGTTATTTTAAPAAGFHPVPLPDPKIPGFAFPEPEPKIVGWTEANDQKAMNQHAWGIWTALTMDSDQTFQQQTLRVFETWADPDDLLAVQKGTALTSLPRIPRRLKRPHQFAHPQKLKAALVGGNESTVLAFVKYDPMAAEHITKNQLFSATALNNLMSQGQAAVPDFPNPSLSLKPVFQTLSANQLVGGRYYQLRTWPGSPQLTLNSSTGMYDSKPFPQQLWGQCVWIDTQAKGNGPGTGGVDTKCAKDGSSRTDASTYGVDDFIHFQLTQAEVDLQNAEAKSEGSSAVAQVGNYSVLVAMHVTSREITRWTWQTFWWLPNPDQPAAPSSPAIAALRPPQLQGAARNYAHCVAYSMENPPQPNTGGSNTGDSIYCFNPYLEAPFDPSDLPDSMPGTTMLNGKAVKTPNNVGAQTNCMSCHEQANYNPNSLQTAPAYTGDRYVDLDSPAFNGTLKVDFLWSIPGNVH